MRTLSLFPQAPQAEVGWEEPLPIDGACTRCELGASGVRTRCMRPEGKPGGLYLIAEMPGRTEDATGRPFTGGSGKYLRSLVARHWQGPVALDNAVRCAPGARETKEKFVDACRPYTAQVLREVKPARIVALGGWGAYAILGRKPPVLSVRRGHGWWIDEERYPDPASYVPVFFTVNPAAALRNRFVARDFEDDLKWALTAPVPSPRFLKAETFYVERAVDAQVARVELAAGFVFDTETSGVMFDPDFRIECLTLYVRGGARGYTWDRGALEDPAVRAPLLALLRDHRVPKVGHNLKYDALAVMCEPLLAVDTTPGMAADTRLFRKLLDGDVDAKLEVAAEVVGMGGHKEEADAIVDQIKVDLAKLAHEPFQKPLKSGKPRKPYAPKVLVRDEVPEEILERLRRGEAGPIQFAYRFLDPVVRARYNARDAFATTLLDADYTARVLAKKHLVNIWDGVMKPAMQVLTRMERKGVAADRLAIDTFEAHLTVRIDALAKQLAVHSSINYDSPKQLAELLFGKLGLPVVKHTASGAHSTDADVLEALKGKHPIIDALLEYRQLTKLRSTYATGMRPHVRADGRIHTSFLLDGAGTGRMSSQGPNLQNIPSADRDPVHGKMARDIFVARPGYVLLEADFSQLELRIAAMISQDPVMIAMFNDAATDFHAATAALVCDVAWGVKDWGALSAVDKKKYRSMAKTINFGVHYGKTAEGLAREMGCSAATATRIVEAILGKFKVLRATIDRTKAEANKTGGVFVYWRGEKANWRPLPGLGAQGDEARGIRSNANNAAWNTPVQGTAAHYATASLHPIQQEFDQEGLDAHLVLTVHDSILTEVRADQADEAEAIMVAVMTGHPSGGVPLVVDTKRGTAWGSMK